MIMFVSLRSRAPPSSSAPPDFIDYKQQSCFARDLSNRDTMISQTSRSSPLVRPPGPGATMLFCFKHANQ